MTGPTSLIAIGLIAGAGLTALAAAALYARKPRARALGKDEARFVALVQRGPIGVHRTRLDGRLQDCNDAYARLLGYDSRSDCLARIRTGAHATVETRTTLVNELLKSGQVANLESQWTRCDGSTVWVLQNATLQRSDGADAETFIEGTVTDVTEQHHAREAQARAIEAAESASRAKSQFLANMSHEIRTPMNGILGMTELALGTSLTPEQREYLETVQDSAESLLGLINEALDFAKIESGQLVLEIVDFDVRHLVEETLRGMATRAHQKGLELACLVAEDVPQMVPGDPVRVRQILVNLLSNAVKFTAAGEIILRVTQAHASDDGVTLAFEVADTGIGIPLDMQPAIFEAFTQADPSTTRRFGGTGLGLAMVSQLTGLMGGGIGLKSRPGEGSTFLVKLPFRRTTAVASGALPSADFAGVRVLLVDDNASARWILRDILTRWGARVSDVDGRAAATRAVIRARESGDPFGVALVDQRMPESSGLDLVAEWRRLPHPCPPVLLMIVPAGDGHEARRAVEVGVSAVLTKPIRQAALRQAMLTALTNTREAIAPVGPLFTPPVPRAEAEAEPTPPVVSQGAPSASAAPGQPHGRRDGVLRILLAEDNQVNRRLAVAMLEKAGHIVDTVENGRLAVEAVRSSHYDLALMDLQMPQMDGFQATAAIRQSEAGSQAHLPIVALTAHAMRGDREACLAAGMDGYLSKPLRSADLMATIDAVLGRAAGPVPSSVPTLDTGSAEPAFRLAEVLERVQGDWDLLVELVEILKTEAPRLLGDINDAVAAGDARALERAAHRLRGSVASFGAVTATELAHIVENFAREGNLAAAEPAAARLTADVDRLVVELTGVAEGARA
jgi:PAS domain S-box-containing protein